MKLTLLQRQSLKTALLVAFFLTTCVFIFSSFLSISVLNLALLFLLCVIFVLLVFNHHIKKFMSLQLKRVYESNLFKNEAYLKENLDFVNLEAFIERIKDFAEHKHKEIDQLHNRDDFRRDFIGDVSHELKTPLFTAQGYLLTVLDDSIEDPVLRKKYLERTNKSIERLNYIVKDLDMISKLESGMKLDQLAFNIVKTTAEVFEILEMKANKKNINLDFFEPYNFPILVRADKEKIEQVLINLISNSINYGKVNGSILVKIKNQSDSSILISIIDDGVGIDQKHLPRLFERFYRIDKSRSRDQGGSGLGLAIVKHIVEAHDQEIFVDSELGQGSTFSFTLNKVI